MGVFFDSPAGRGEKTLLPVSTVHDMVHASLAESPPAAGDDLDARTNAIVNSATAQAAGAEVPASLQALRLLVAVGLVAGLVIGGVVTEANGWTDSSTAIWALATTAFGVIVGLLGGEAKHT